MDQNKALNQARAYVDNHLIDLSKAVLEMEDGRGHSKCFADLLQILAGVTTTKCVPLAISLIREAALKKVVGLESLLKRILLILSIDQDDHPALLEKARADLDPATEELRQALGIELADLADEFLGDLNKG